MEETTGRKPGSRRKATFWALFGTVGLIMGAAYATGFVSTNNTAPADANNGAATQLFGTPSVANTSLYKGAVAVGTPLAITFDGNYGVIAADTNLFTIDLTGNDPYGVAYAAGNTYYADILLTNWSTLGMVGANPEWDTLEFKFQEVDCTTAAWTPGTTTWASYTSPAPTTAVMVIDRVDAHVTFSGLAGAKKYCFGVAAANATTESAALQASAAGSIADTVLFRPSSTVIPTDAPNFTLTLNRSA